MSVLIAFLLSHGLVLGSLDFLRVYQSSGYRGKEYFPLLKELDYATVLVAGALGVAVALVFERLVARAYGIFGVIAALIFAVTVIFTRKHTPPFKLTPRILRQMAVLLVLDFMLAASACLLAERGFCSYAWLCGLFFLQILLVPAAGSAMLPIERRIARRYVSLAKARLSAVRPIVVGVTGSFGKTSVKRILATILSQRYRVCVTPANFNTPMGLCRTLNEHLKDNDEILIAEMGARYTGDIAALAQIAHPDVAVITGIGNQHLATFGSKSALMDAKYELVDALDAGAPAFFAEDDGSFALYKRGHPQSFCARVNCGRYYVGVSDLRVTARGSDFLLRKDGVSVQAHTCLIGAHNVANVRLACMVASFFGLSLREIADGIARIESVPHRLQLLPCSGNMQVIDDSYNGSKEGIFAAMKTLSLFSGVRIVITPGVIECGKDEYVTNYQCGLKIGEVADFVFVYGENAKALTDGAVCAGLSAERVLCVRSRERAVEKISAVKAARMTVIFCNDLPK